MLTTYFHTATFDELILTAFYVAAEAATSLKTKHLTAKMAEALLLSSITT